LRPGDDEVVLLDDARVRPRPLLAPAAAAPRAAADWRPLLTRHPRVAEPVVGEPRRPQRAVLAVLLPARAGGVPRAAARRRARPLTRRHQPRQDVADPDLVGRGHVWD